MINIASKYSFSDVIEEFKKHEEYILLSTENEFKNSSTKMRYICTRHQEKGELQITLNHLMSDRGCMYCGRERTATARRKDFDIETDKQLCENNNFEYKKSFRKNSKLYISFICNKHKELGEQYMQKHNMQRNIKGCKYCAGKKLPEWYVMKKANEVNPNVIILDKYKNLTTRMLCECKVHHVKSYKSMQEIFQGRGCVECGKEKLSNTSTSSIEEVEDNIKNKYPHIKPILYFGATNNKSVWYCQKHDKEFTKSYDNMLRVEHSGCDECSKERYIENGLGHDEFVRRLNIVHPSLSAIDTYSNNHTKLKFYCNEHDYYFYDTSVTVLNRLSCCKKSRVTYKEESVCRLLEKWGYNITRQKVFQDCVDKRVLPFDIYLNDFNILIEYQGEQHYQIVRYSSETEEKAKDRFEYTKKHDLIKKEYCDKKSIPFIKIPYWEFDNLEYFLFSKLVKYGAIEELQIAN